MNWIKIAILAISIVAYTPIIFSQIADYSSTEKFNDSVYNGEFVFLPTGWPTYRNKGLEGHQLIDMNGDAWVIDKYFEKDAENAFQISKSNLTRTIFKKDFLDFYLKLGFEKYQKNHIGKELKVISSESSVFGYDQNHYQIFEGQILIVEEISIARFSKQNSSEYAYKFTNGMVLKLNDGFDCRFSFEGNDHGNDVRCKELDCIDSREMRAKKKAMAAVKKAEETARKTVAAAAETQKAEDRQVISEEELEGFVHADLVKNKSKFSVREKEFHIDKYGSLAQIIDGKEVVLYRAELIEFPLTIDRLEIAEENGIVLIKSTHNDFHFGSISTLYLVNQNSCVIHMLCANWNDGLVKMDNTVAYLCEFNVNEKNEYDLFDKQTNKFIPQKVDDSFSTFSSKFSTIKFADAVLISEDNYASKDKVKAEVAKARADAEVDAIRKARKAAETARDGYKSKDIDEMDFDSIGKISRGVEKRVYPNNVASYNGIIVFNLCIDRSGKVVYLEYNEANSTITNEKAITEISDSIKKTKFLPSNNAPTKECGQ